MLNTAQAFININLVRSALYENLGKESFLSLVNFKVLLNEEKCIMQVFSRKTIVCSRI